MSKIAEVVTALEAVIAENHNGSPLLEELLAALEAALKALVAQIAAEIAAEIGHNGGPPLDERVAALEAVVAKIGHNGGPPLDDDEPPPPKRKAGLLPDREVARRYGVSTRTVDRWGANPGLGFPAAVYIRRRKYRDAGQLNAWDKARRAADPSHELRYVPEALSRPRAKRGRFTKPEAR